jgi:transcriptional regulator with XRE-family HTH domain
MKLKPYLADAGLSYAAFARMIGVDDARTVQRYAEGLRHPRPAIMMRILTATNGEVTANDFFHPHQAA